MKSAPTRERFRMSRLKRPTKKFSPGLLKKSSVWMSSTPMLLRPDFPATRAPPWMGIGVPASDRPMRRLKNKSVCTGVDVNALPVPMVKKFEFSRKKSRFSG
ncbi:hypothetical protein D3C83_57470 [compost metagenome]